VLMVEFDHPSASAMSTWTKRIRRSRTGVGGRV
jgi:hypothetical protein